MCDHVQTEAMKEYEDIQDDPYLGICWIINGRVSDVSKQLAGECRWNSNGCRTVGTLHKDYWRKMKQRMNFKLHKHDTIYESDYTQIPRIRIFEYRQEPRWRVMCGSWINSEIEEMVREEFFLPDEAVFIVDTHWELGHGWSEEYML